MANSRTPALPTVLKQYKPDYEPNSPSNTPAPPQQHFDKDTVSPRPQQKDGSQSMHSGPSKPHSSKSKGRRKTMHRERTMEIQRKHEIKKYEHNYEAWQQVKTETRLQDTEYLRSKIALQKELIKCQDELHQKQLQEEQLEAQKKRENERNDKQAKFSALQEVCRQSLDEDRKRLEEKRAEKIERKLKKEGMERKSKKSAEHPRQTTFATEASTHSSLISGPLTDDKSHYSPQGSFLDEADEELDESEAEDEVSELPWHHNVLYDMYGKDADYFLHPKPQAEKKKVVKAVNPKLSLQGGRAGAKTLWTTLRNDSTNKLLRQDSYIPRELKSAYSAFVRQCLAKRKTPVKRNYYAEEDVPEMDRLLDQSKVAGALDYRHKIELMYRSSVNNKDRTNVLRFNNPPPEVLTSKEMEGICHYFPSWMDQYDDDASSNPSYAKWLEPQNRNASVLSGAEDFESKGQKSISRNGTNEWQFLTDMSYGRQKNKPKDQKLSFLTEKDTAFEGEFSKKRKEQNQPTIKFQDNNRPKAQSALALRGGGDGPGSLTPLYGRRGEGSPKASENSSRTTLNQPRSQSEMTHLKKFMTEWEPLTLGAMMEYSDTKSGPGGGKLAMGEIPRWVVDATA